MTRFALGFALVLLFALLGLAAMVYVTGPGWSIGAGGDAGSGPLVPRAAPPAAGSLTVPVQGVARSALADSWSERHKRVGRNHRAIDIAAPDGTPVLAAADGRIVKLREGRRDGIAVYERSADGGTVYYYAHLDHYAPGLAEGQAVRAGQAIAALGSTGDADPAAPHLHFEIRRMAPGEGWWQGRAVNPYPLLRAGG